MSKDEPSFEDAMARYSRSRDEVLTVRLSPCKAIPVDQWREETQLRGGVFVRAHDWKRYVRYLLRVAAENERIATQAQLWWAWWEKKQVEPSKAGPAPLVSPGIEHALRIAAARRGSQTPIVTPNPQGDSNEPDALNLCDALQDLYMDAGNRSATGGLEAHEALFGEQRLHEALVALGRMRKTYKARHADGEVKRVADFPVASGHEAVACFAERVAGYARVRMSSIPRSRAVLDAAKAKGKAPVIALAEVRLHEAGESFAAAITQAFDGWFENYSLIRRCIEQERMRMERASAAGPIAPRPKPERRPTPRRKAMGKVDKALTRLLFQDYAQGWPLKVLSMNNKELAKQVSGPGRRLSSGSLRPDRTTHFRAFRAFFIAKRKGKPLDLISKVPDADLKEALEQYVNEKSTELE